MQSRIQEPNETNVPQPAASMRTFSFDLGPALDRTGSIFAKNPERLRFALEGRIAGIAPDAWIRFASTSFLLTVPPCSEEEATLLCMRVNMEVLRTLFGTDRLIADQIMTIFRPATPAEQPAAEAGIPRAGGDGAQAAALPAASRITRIGNGRSDDRFSVGTHRDIELRFVPVHDLRRNAVSTFFCSPVVSIGADDVLFGYGAFQRLGPGEYPYVDAALLEFSSLLSNRLAEAGVMAVVGSSVNYETLAWTKGREIFLDALCRSGTARNPYLMLKIDCVPRGVPASRLADLVSAVKPYVRRVFVRLPEGEARLDYGGGNIGAAGFVTSLPPRPTRPVIAAVAKSLMRTCEAQAALACVDSVDSQEALDIVQAIGVRFGAGRVFGARLFRWNDSVEDIRAFMQGLSGESLPVASSLQASGNHWATARSVA